MSYFTAAVIMVTVAWFLFLYVQVAQPADSPQVDDEPGPGCVTVPGPSPSGGRSSPATARRASRDGAP